MHSLSANAQCALHRVGEGTESRFKLKCATINCLPGTFAQYAANVHLCNAHCTVCVGLKFSNEPTAFQVDFAQCTVYAHCPVAKVQVLK